MSVELHRKNELENGTSSQAEPCVAENNSKRGGNKQEVSIIDSIPIKVVLTLASPYLAGETAIESVELAHEIFAKDGYTSTLDILGEDMKSAKDCEQSVEAYKNLADTMSARPLAAKSKQEAMTISLKPSMFSVRPPAEQDWQSDSALLEACERIRSVVAYAGQKGIKVTLEAEDHRWTDFQLDVYFRLVEEGLDNLGTVLQSRLFRTADDLARFDSRHRVRMVIGIYNEPARISHTSKERMKDLLVDYAGDLLSRGVYVEIATHDADCIADFFKRVVIPGRRSAERFELQFLHGVPREQLQKSIHDGSYFAGLDFYQADSGFLQELISQGVVIRKYLPFGPDRVAGAYCRRRLKENPNMIGYGIKNLFGWQR